MLSCHYELGTSAGDNSSLPNNRLSQTAALGDLWPVTVFVILQAAALGMRKRLI